MLQIDSAGVLITFAPFYRREVRWPSGRASDFEARSQGFESHSDRRVTSLSKIHLPKSTGNTSEAVAPSRHD